MEKVKELTQKYLKDSSEEAERKEKDMDKLKPSINNLLYMHLPCDLTLKEVDIIAMVMIEMIWNPYDFLRQQKEK